MTRITSAAALALLLIATAIAAQTTVPPPPKPVNDAPANAEVLMLLRAGMPESVVLDKIHAITGKFDTSTNALITLKQAGATEAELKAVMAQGAAPADSQSATASTTSGPSLAETMQFIRDKVNEQGKIVYVNSSSYTSGESLGNLDYTQESQVVAVDPAGGLSLQDKTSLAISDITSNTTATWQVNFKDIKKLEVLNSSDYKHRLYPGRVYQDDPPFFELFVQLASGKTVREHIKATVCSKGVIIPKQSCKSSESDYIAKEFLLHFRDEETADRVAKAMIHVIELCGGGSQPEPF
jgi:hypothetical protein